MRIAMAAFTHEANSFCPVAATQESFEARAYGVGDELYALTVGARTEPAGALDVFRAERDVSVIPLLMARAGSSAPITSETYTAIRDELLARLRASLPLDGVLLVLHGAMMAEETDDATGDVLDAVRTIVGEDTPILGTLDLHANVTQRMAEAATVLVGYHTAPHVDMYEAGETAAKLLLATLRGNIRPTPALVRLPLIVPAENARHTDGPLSKVINRVLHWEREGSILHGGVFAVQPWLDAPDVGCSVYVVTDDDPHTATSCASELATMFWERRGAFVPELYPPAKALQRALADPPRRIILCDSADATSSGSTGDGTAILKAVLDAGATNVPILLNIVDTQAAHAAAAAGIGSSIRIALGGKLAPQYAEPVVVNAYVKSLSDGIFRFHGPGMRGVQHRMGPTAVLTIGQTNIVVMSQGVTQWDPQLYRSQGLDPAYARITQVKSPAAFRAGYDGLYDEIVIVDAPGAASPNLTALPWDRLGRPIYPLDPDIEFDLAAHTWRTR